jgi:orotate phosphoribosyltransferase
MSDVLAELEHVEAIYLGQHFVYKSGKHGSGYINMDPLFPHIQLVAKLCGELAGAFLEEFDTVAAPAIGGIELSLLTALAHHNRTGQITSGVWADKVDGGFAFDRAGFTDHIRHKRVLVVEDLLTTGGSVAQVCRLVESHGGIVIGVGAICNRGGVTARDLDVPHLHTLSEVDFQAVDAAICPDCVAGKPIVADIGHGEAYRQAHPDYAGGYISLLA